ncbi:hypothetical protein MMC24_003392 [Lignoscripta atroalba]|nr:hypothetical protein [Lignoscripta atroalba]
MVTSQELNAKREAGCFAYTTERKYYAFETQGSFMKRSLRPHELQRNIHGNLVIPLASKERLMNEAASLSYIRKMTNIPVPTVFCAFEDDGAYYLITEYVQGVDMADLSEDQKVVVTKEIQLHLATMRELKSTAPGGPTGFICPPYRAAHKAKKGIYSLRPSVSKEYVFCHNDLSQHNIVVDPETLKINGIIDWEYAGFYPEYFEGHFYRRPGPSAALRGESDNTDKLLEFLVSQTVCVHETAGCSNVLYTDQ